MDFDIVAGFHQILKMSPFECGIQSVESMAPSLQKG